MKCVCLCLFCRLFRLWMGPGLNMAPTDLGTHGCPKLCRGPHKDGSICGPNISRTNERSKDLLKWVRFGMGRTVWLNLWPPRLLLRQQWQVGEVYHGPIIKIRWMLINKKIYYKWGVGQGSQNPYRTYHPGLVWNYKPINTPGPSKLMSNPPLVGEHHILLKFRTGDPLGWAVLGQNWPNIWQSLGPIFIESRRSF